jgi:hypothetical protein
MGNVLSPRLNEGDHKKKRALDDDMVGGRVNSTGAAFPTLHYTRQTCNPQRSSPWMFYLKTALTFAKHSGKYVVGKKRERNRKGRNAENYKFLSIEIDTDHVLPCKEGQYISVLVNV